MHILQSGKAAAHTDTILRLIAVVLEQQSQAENAEVAPLMPETQAKLVTLLKTMPAEQLQAHGLAAFVQ